MKISYFKKNIVLVLLLLVQSSLAADFKVPQKFIDSSLHHSITADTRFSDLSVATADFIRIKNEEWSACHQSSPGPVYYSSENQDLLYNFLESTTVVDSLEKMEALAVTQSTVPVQPWSGDYWPYAKGLLGARSFDTTFTSLLGWLEKFDFIKSESADRIIEKHGQHGILKLSPAEKYDLLVGDSTNGLTNSMWDQGKRFHDERGEVEGWMGICHGWAPAAIVEPRPTSTVDATSLSRQWQIQLVPAEIKGLVSYNWATNDYANASLGHRCNKKNPKRDENGRLTDPECFDLSPATWHLATVNQVGLAHRSFVMDASFDYEVWNQPVLGYSYSYFNVKTKKAEKNLANAKVFVADHTLDPYKKYRSSQARTLVGISMKVGYVIETSTNQQATDSPQDDAIRWVQYDYDLEIDKFGKIIGGEWHQVAHPDFIWTPLKNARPLSLLDLPLNRKEWITEGPIGAAGANAARSGSPRGIVLDTIATALLRKSAKD